MSAESSKVLEVEITVDALVIGKTTFLTQDSVAAALRSVASQLDAAGSTPIASEQFRTAARLFEKLPEPEPETALPRRGLLRRLCLR